MEEHPEELHEPAIFMVLIAFQKAFPCEPLNKEGVKRTQ
jgi:hypothetical protein